jgi:hypothetical protein
MTELKVGDLGPADRSLNQLCRELGPAGRSLNQLCRELGPAGPGRSTSCVNRPTGKAGEGDGAAISAMADAVRSAVVRVQTVRRSTGEGILAGDVPT